jgi:hypothetical protein
MATRVGIFLPLSSNTMIYQHLTTELHPEIAVFNQYLQALSKERIRFHGVRPATYGDLCRIIPLLLDIEPSFSYPNKL